MSRSHENNLQLALKACKGSFISVGFFSLFVNALMLVPTLYMIQISGRVVPSSSVPTLLMLTLILTVLMITMGALEWVRSRIMVRISNRLDVLLSRDVYRASFRKALRSGGMDASAQSLNDLTSLRQFLTGNGLFAFFDAPWLPIYTAVMFLFHPWFGWMTVGSAIVLIILAYLNHRFTGKALTEANQQSMVANLVTTKNLRNAEVIESMGMLDTLMARWGVRQRRVLVLQSDASDKGGIVTSISKTFRNWAQSIMLALGAYLVITHQMNPGLMMAGSLLLGRALSPVDQIIGTWKGFVAARVQYTRLSETLEKLHNEPDRMALPDPEGHIQVENLVVTPPGGKNPVIRNISFVTPAGTIVGIVGPSAAGKSTLVRALLGIWPAQHGTVRLDGADISAWDKQKLGPHLGYLPQDIELFEGSISDNIARFAKVDPEKVVLAARTAGVHEMILQLPDGYDTVIGSDGVNLSGGQRQRIGLARAIYGSPRLIVLDEPNSNLDEVGERALSVALQLIKESGATVFIVSHRPNILSRLDRVMVMSAGTITLYGARDQVIAELAQQQAKAQQAQQRVAPAATGVGPAQPGA
ncbi:MULTISPECIES: type I secretion system permease/ATPase [Pseudomonas syringae group]|jgi:ATP-binding cassette subfamily C protein EexD|uniref:Type I secretion system ABC-type transporter, PrtD family n=2 Tax=Pseudomonas syringae group TaxID=136849 RepID=A0A3M4Y8S1_9PSED|nr:MULTISPECIES: type I secretion system permease/ATPase [Pseudomonas syringae group]KTC04192.1 peptidase [Pseudomonas syringae ICMP 11168]MBS7412283.1 type I secretion system permease/ATPase [Pseudomonas syringae]MCF5028163.1 type I secretion system permease/ATPase [Pseudomonas syringae]MCF5649194.1 type I secretion system permease/ATPase [Pseudomonas syringae]MCF5734256.1 type I secretion system permease/ATPase [Pseudomonas syringae]